MFVIELYKIKSKITWCVCGQWCGRTEAASSLAAWKWCREDERKTLVPLNICWRGGVCTCCSRANMATVARFLWQQYSSSRCQPACCPCLVFVVWSAWSKALDNTHIIKTWWPHSPVRCGFVVVQIAVQSCGWSPQGLHIIRTTS